MIKPDIFLLLLFLTISCSDPTNNLKENENKQETEKNEISDSLNIGLTIEMNGKWINTTLFDSTLNFKKINPWLNDFYGDLLLTIYGSDSADISGNMDGGMGKINVLNSKSFSFPERNDNPIFIYDSEKDYIYSKTSLNKKIIFRRVSKKDKLEIIANEKAFNIFFIESFFNDYFSKNEKEKIVEIWDGFETYTPFEFDAIGILSEKKEVEYFAWKFNGDTLELYETFFEYDEDSGFRKYKIEDLKYKLTKK